MRRDVLRMKKVKIAIATTGQAGLDDEVAPVFGRANTFTIVDVEDREIHAVKVLENPATSYAHGAGPLVVKELVDLNVDAVIAPDFGPGASTLLKQHHITTITSKPGEKVKRVVQKSIKK